jgi:DNA repair exonuclease SbcCD ATPase subunit
VNFHLQEIESLQNSLREREKYVTELENRLRALWDKLEGERKHYEDRIKRLEEALESIREYWNRDNNNQALIDACWYAIDKAAEALEAKEAKL